MSIEFATGAVLRLEYPGIPEIREELPSSTVAVVALEGPQGPPGPSGSGSGAYLRHEQTSPASVVTIEHNFGRWPAAVMLTSLDGSITFDEFGLQFIDLNTIRISIDQPTAYVALIV